MSAGPVGPGRQGAGPAGDPYPRREVPMVRLLLSALVGGLFLCTGAVVAEEKKDKTVTGTFESYKDGTLTLKVDGKTMDYKVAPDLKAKVWSPTGDTSKDELAREGFKDQRPGTQVTLTLGDGDKITAVTIG